MKPTSLLAPSLFASVAVTAVADSIPIRGVTWQWCFADPGLDFCLRTEDAMAGLGYKKCSVHKLRHTAATLMYQTGEVDVRVLKDILGHEQLNTTQIYTHVSNRQMETAMSKNPLASAARLKKAKTLQPYDEDPSDKEE